MKSAAECGLSVPAATGVASLPGRGGRATVDGRALAAGGPNLLASLRVSPAAELRDFAQQDAARGQGVIYLVESERTLAAFAVAPRPESARAVRPLHEAGTEVVMTTGDARAVAEAVARELGIDTVLAEVLPEQKASHIEALRRQGKRVAMVGDGVNHVPALVTTDVGVAIGAGTDEAVEAGDVVLVRSDPRDAPRIINLSCRARAAGRWCRTCRGRPATTSSRSRWPPACSRRGGSCSRRPPARCRRRSARSAWRSTRSCSDAPGSERRCVALSASGPRRRFPGRLSRGTTASRPAHRARSWRSRPHSGSASSGSSGDARKEAVAWFVRPLVGQLFAWM